MMAKYLSCAESACSSCIDREKLMSIVYSSSLDAAARHRCLGRQDIPAPTQHEPVRPGAVGRQGNRAHRGGSVRLVARGRRDSMLLGPTYYGQCIHIVKMFAY